jgi:hypothetical protein
VAEELQSREDIEAHNAARASFYRVKGRNHSNTSIESEALLDHRYVGIIKAEINNC